MKGKTTLWILIPAVLGIWGAIGWQVYAAMKGDEDNAAPKVISTETGENKTIVPDTFSLLLDYPDPFAAQNTKPKVNVKSQAQITQPKTTAPVPEQTQWPNIVYSGLVKQPSSGKMLGFLSVNGVSYFVKEGDEVGGVRVDNIAANQITVQWNRERKLVSK
ncbi:MAG: hypothetical protein L6Q81_12665 [Bacteroidia bacterium]|nr:hypothetical protein [Bacteroidia bacterium]